MKPIAALLAATLVLGPVAQALAGATANHVRKTNGCCCLAWMEQFEENGFAPTGENVFAALLVRYKLDNGVPQLVVSCHTAEVEGCIIEGHVPAADIRRLLEERPDAVGLAVPDRTCGSPRMGPESEREAYDLLLIRRDGSTEVFTGYEAALRPGRVRFRLRLGHYDLLCRVAKSGIAICSEIGYPPIP